MNKKFLIGSLIGLAFFGAVIYGFNQPDELGASTLRVSQGGTGATTFATGECLIGNGTGAIQTQSCAAGGGGGDSLWATTTTNLFIYPKDTNDVVVIGRNSTTTLGNIFEVHGTSHLDNVYMATIASGTWNGSTITVPYGGTGSTTLTGLLKGNGTGSILTATPGTDYLTTVASDATWTTHNSYPSACSAGTFVTGIGDTLTCTASSTNSDSTWTLHNNYPTACPLGQVVSAIGDTLTCVATSTNANTATALASDPTDCSAGTFATAIAASGNLTCTASSTNSDSTWTLHNNYPAACAAGEYVSAIGDTLTCGTPAGGSGGTGVGWATSSATQLYSTYNFVGIGTTAPAYTLDVAGTASIGTGTTIFTTQSSGASTTNLSVSGWSFFTGLITAVNETLTGLFTAVNATITGILKIPNSTALQTGTAGEIGIDTTSNQLRYYGSATSTISPYQFQTLTIASTTWNSIAGATASSTIPLGVAYQAETWSSFTCYTDTGTILAKFGDGTNYMTTVNASSTAGNISVASNNQFTANEKKQIVVSNAASTPNFLTCTIKKAYDAD